MRRYFYFLRSLALWLVFGLSIFLIALFSPLVYIFAKDSRLAFKKAVRFAAASMLFLSGIKVEVIGGEDLSGSECFLIAVNHSSFLDNLVLLGHLPLFFSFVADLSGFSLPFIRRIYKGAGFIRTGLKMGFNDIIHLYKELKQKENVLIYGFVRGEARAPKFSKALVAFAREAGVPVLPVYLDGCSEVLPMNKFVIRSGKNIKIVIGKPISFPDLEALQAEIKKLEDRCKFSGPGNDI